MAGTNKRFSISKVTIYVMLIPVLWVMFNMKHWEKGNRVIYWDIVSYYAYLPATFIYNDITLEFTDNYKGVHEYKFWPLEAPNGSKVIKTSMGLSFLYAPFFFVAHVVALHTGYDAGGFSQPYKFALMIGGALCFFIGLFFLRRFLLQYFSDCVVAITLIAIVFGTNLFYYSAIEATMPHVYNFMLISIYLWLTIKWYKNPAFINSLLIGIISGLITLIRPTNILVLLVFILFNIRSISGFKHRIRFLLSKYKLIITIAVCFLIVWIPQFVYWKTITGHYIYYSYGEDERFFFLNPQIINGLFSYRKGWFIYAPIMLFSVIGIGIMYRNLRQHFLAVSLFFVVNVYIIFSWWSWWYGGSYGIRPLIDTYPVLAIPMAVFISKILTQKLLLKISLLIVTCLLIIYGIFGTVQYYYGAIHWEAMSKEAFWDSFGRTKPSPKLEKLLKYPDYEQAKKGIQAVKSTRDTLSPNIYEEEKQNDK